MKRTILICAMLCLIISVSASAQKWDHKGNMWATGHLGYAIGMGTAFSSYSIAGTEFSCGPGIGFGGQFYYGVQDNLFIGGELMFQSYTAKMSAPANLALGIPAMDISESQTEFNVIVNALYGISKTRNSSLFLTGGTGLYDYGGMQMGLNTGLVWRKQVSDKVYLYGMPRLHVVLAETTPMMIQLTMGAQFSLGG